MRDQFKAVDSDLNRLLKQLHVGRDEMRTALSVLKGTGPKSTGSEALDDACDESYDSWDSVTDKVTDGVQEIQEKLRATKNEDKATEEAIRDAMQKGTVVQATPSPSSQTRPIAGAR